MWEGRRKEGEGDEDEGRKEEKKVRRKSDGEEGANCRDGK